ncbi:MAG: hypothetical protein ACJ71A_12045 [Nitrososphaeraceae archaeon]
MFIIKYRQRLSSIVIGAVILSFFLLAVIIVVSDNAIHIQANAKKEMIVSTPVSLTPSSLNDNSVLNDQNTTTATNNNNNSSSYLTYEDNADGISLMYPSNWQKIEYPSGAMNYGKGHRIIASFLAPLDPSDQWRGSLNIQISNLSDSKNIIPQNATTTMINLGGHPAFKLEYTNTERMYLNRDLTSSSSIKLKVMQVWTSIGDSTYLLTYNAEASKYPQYLPIIYKMLSSFRVS